MTTTGPPVGKTTATWTTGDDVISPSETIPSTTHVHTSVAPDNSSGLGQSAIIGIAVGGFVFLAATVTIIVCCLCKNRSKTIQRMRRNTNSQIERVKSKFLRQAKTPSGRSISESDGGPVTDLQDIEASVKTPAVDHAPVKSLDRTPGNAKLTQKVSMLPPPHTMNPESEKVQITEPRGWGKEAPPPQCSIAIKGYMDMKNKSKSGNKTKDTHVTPDKPTGLSELNVDGRTVPLPPGMSDNPAPPSPHVNPGRKPEYVNSAVNPSGESRKASIPEDLEDYENTSAWHSMPTLNPASGNAAVRRPSQPGIKSAKPSVRPEDPADSYDFSPATAPQQPKQKLNLKASVPVAAAPDEIYENTDFESDTGKKPGYQNVADNKLGYQNMGAILEHERKQNQASLKSDTKKTQGYLNLLEMTANEK